MNENKAKFIFMTFVLSALAEAICRGLFPVSFFLGAMNYLNAELTVFWCYILVNLDLFCQYVKFH